MGILCVYCVCSWFFHVFLVAVFSNISLGTFEGNIEHWRYCDHSLKGLFGFFNLFFKESCSILPLLFGPFVTDIMSTKSVAAIYPNYQIEVNWVIQWYKSKYVIKCF